MEIYRNDHNREFHREYWCEHCGVLLASHHHMCDEMLNEIERYKHERIQDDRRNLTTSK
ncbi:MAG: hypothetical protein KAS32_14530 [Candidatus Peribacteraceae bacterium]|nr:hypothetical protein [Candidatus Peribacteraceae bacterium]